MRATELLIPIGLNSIGLILAIFGIHKVQQQLRYMNEILEDLKKKKK